MIIPSLLEAGDVVDRVLERIGFGVDQRADVVLSCGDDSKQLVRALHLERNQDTRRGEGCQTQGKPCGDRQ